MIDKSGFIRRLHKLQAQLTALFLGLGNTLKELNTTCRYLMDSFPVVVCDNIRIPRCRLLQGEAYRGKNASKRRYFYGFKVQLITPEDGLPVEFFIRAGSFADVKAFKAMTVDLPEQSQLYGASGYTCYETENLFAECERIELKICCKSNSKRKHQLHQAFLKNYYRKLIETTFSGMTNFFSKKIHAVTPQGFLLKLILFIFAYTLNQII